MKKPIIYLLFLFAAVQIEAQTLIATSNSIEATANHNQRKIVRDSLDNVYVVFVDSTEQGKIIKGLWLNRQSKEWSSTVEIAEGTNPTLSINKYGKFSLVFESNDSLKVICWKSSPDFVNWSPVNEISEPGFLSHLPVCDADSSGNFNVFWIKEQNDSFQSLVYARIADDTLNFKKTIATKSVINDVAIANHLQNFNDELIFSIQFNDDSLQFFRSKDNVLSLDTLYETKGSQPCISFNSISQYYDKYLNPIRLLYIDGQKQLTEVECGLDSYEEDNLPTKIISSEATDYVCIDDVLIPLGYSYLMMKNGILYHGFSYGAYGGWNTILDTISTNPINPSLAYKNFSPLYIDYIWMQRNNNSFDIFYKRDEKQKDVGIKDYESGKGFTLTGYPNPFYDKLNIEIDINNNTAIPIVEIYNIDSKKLGVLQPINQSKGKFNYSWDVSNLDSDLPTGMYFIKCIVGNTVTARKVMYIK